MKQNIHHELHFVNDKFIHRIKIGQIYTLMLIAMVSGLGEFT